MKLSVEARWSIVTFMKQSGGDVRFTARHVPCHIKAVRRWWGRFRKSGTVRDAPRSGRPSLISKRGSRKALALLRHIGSNGAADVAQQLAVKGITDVVVHKATVIRAARRAAATKGKTLVAKRGPPLKGMRECTKEKRLAFAAANQETDWGNVLFTDRKRFYLRYPGSKVKPVRWVFEGELEEDDVFQPTNPQCFNVYAGISPHGLTALHVVAGTSQHSTDHKTLKGQAARNITRSEYRAVLRDTLLPEGTKLFKKKGIKTWYLQQDNDPTHAVAEEVVQQWNKSKRANVKLLPNWPPSSPDLNIIENVWAWVQNQVNKQACPDIGRFKRAVLKAMAAVPQEMIDNLYSSLERRMELVLASGGAPTKY